MDFWLFTSDCVEKSRSRFLMKSLKVDRKIFIYNMYPVRLEL